MDMHAGHDGDKHRGRPGSYSPEGSNICPVDNDMILSKKWEKREYNTRINY